VISSEDEWLAATASTTALAAVTATSSDNFDDDMRELAKSKSF